MRSADRVPPRGGRLVLLAGALLALCGIIVGLWPRGVPVGATLPGAHRRSAGTGAGDATVFLATLRARVISSAGTPMVGALVVAERLRPGGVAGPPHGGRTGPRGAFSLAVAEPGVYRLVISAPGRARQVRQVSILAVGDRDLGVLSLARHEPIRGLVVDGRGRPLPGAVITAVSALDLAARPLEPPHLAVADARGRFVLNGLAAGAFRLEAHAQGYGAAVLREVPAPALDVRLTLRPLRLVSGRVLREGQPVSGAQVTLVGTGAWPPRRAVTDPKGTFRFPGMRPGIYQLRARLGTWLSPSSEPLDILGEGAVTPVTLHLQAGVVLTGKVTDADSHRPLPGARVVVAEEALALDPLHGTSGPDGSLRIGPLLPGEYVFSAEAEGYLPRQAEPLTVLPGENPALEITLARGAVIAGQVIDDTGRPVPEARIELVGRAVGAFIADRDLETTQARDDLWDRLLQSLSGAPARAPAGMPSLGVMLGPVPLVPGADTLGDLTGGSGLAPAAGYAHGFVTDAQGRFTLRGVPPGTLALVVRHADFVRHRTPPIRLKRGEARREILVRLRPGTTLLGEVVDPERQALVNVQVAVAREGDPFQQAVHMTDGAGAFRFDHLEGEVRLELRAAGFVSRVHRVTVAPSPERPQRVRLTLERAGCELAGQLVDRRQLPVVGARLTAQSLTPDAPSRAVAVSDAQGSYALTGLGALDYEVEVAHADHPTVRFTRRCPGARDRRTLSFGGGLGFEVRDRQTGAPVPAFQFSLASPGRPPIRRTGAAGQASVVPLPAGRYTLTVQALRYAPEVQDVEVRAGTSPRQVTRRGLVVWLRLAGRVAGWVRDDRGLAVAGATVKIGGREGLTDANGRFLVEEVPAGRHALTATHPERGTGRLDEVEVKAGLDRVSLVVDLQPGTTAPRGVVAGIAVRLRDRDGLVVIGAVGPRSAAEQAGLAVGDELLTVDGRDLDGLGVGDVEALLRGVSGTTVVLELRRGGRRLRTAVRRELLD